jgi:hypothetical protein
LAQVNCARLFMKQIELKVTFIDLS